MSTYIHTFIPTTKHREAEKLKSRVSVPAVYPCSCAPCSRVPVHQRKTRPAFISIGETLSSQTDRRTEYRTALPVLSTGGRIHGGLSSAAIHLFYLYTFIIYWTYIQHNTLATYPDQTYLGLIPAILHSQEVLYHAPPEGEDEDDQGGSVERGKEGRNRGLS